MVETDTFSVTIPLINSKSLKKTMIIKMGGFLNDIIKIFGLDPRAEADHKRALEEVKESLKKHLE